MWPTQNPKSLFYLHKSWHESRTALPDVADKTLNVGWFKRWNFILTHNGTRCHGSQPAQPVLCRWSAWTSGGIGARRPPSAAERKQQPSSELRQGFKRGVLIGQDSPGKLVGDNGTSEGHPAASQGGWAELLWFKNQTKFCTCRGWGCTQEALNFISCVFTCGVSYWWV